MDWDRRKWTDPRARASSQPHVHSARVATVNIYPVCEDHTGAVWLGAWNKGLVRVAKDGTGLDILGAAPTFGFQRRCAWTGMGAYGWEVWE